MAKNNCKLSTCRKCWNVLVSNRSKSSEMGSDIQEVSFKLVFYKKGVYDLQNVLMTYPPPTHIAFPKTSSRHGEMHKNLN